MSAGGGIATYADLARTTGGHGAVQCHGARAAGARGRGARALGRGLPMVRGRRPFVPARPHGRGGILSPAPRPPCLGGDFSWDIVGICARAGNTLRRRTDRVPAANATGCHAGRRPAAEAGAARALPAAASPPMQQPAATCSRIRTRESRHIRARLRSSAARNAPPPPSPLTLRGRREKGIREAGTAALWSA